MMTTASNFQDRDLSWVGFNGRVLQEAADPRNPLVERLRFLAIFSSNLDEFYTVRVAGLRSLVGSGQKTGKSKLAPATIVRAINREVDRQQQEFGEIFREQLLPALEEKGIYLIDDEEATPEAAAFARKFVHDHLADHLNIKTVDEDERAFLENKKVYLAVRTSANVYLMRVPVEVKGRFISLPSPEGETHVMYIDDALRLALPDLFPSEKIKGAWEIKLSRDAELYLEKAQEDDLVEKVRHSIERRDSGLPSRFLYDEIMPARVLQKLISAYELTLEDLVPGGRYHNFSDYWSFPAPKDADLYFTPAPPLASTELEGRSFFASVSEKDRLLHFPYQQYDYVVRWLQEAATDPLVKNIKITLYRVAKDSGVVKALIAAAQAGKNITAFVEVKARFDESSNLFWMDRMREAGIEILPNFDDWKVHAKLFLIEREENEALVRYAYLGTGNFNESTARIYSDYALFTADQRLTNEVAEVFKFLHAPSTDFNFEHLLVAPHWLRSGLNQLIDREIAKAKAGQEGRLLLKMNGIDDEKMIKRLYKASQAGVKIQLLVRGICCVRPGIPGLSENITITSILGRFLEHARVYLAGSGADEVIYLASADLMRRNLSSRVEVAFPLLDTDLYQKVKGFFELQLADETRARHIDDKQKNHYVGAGLQSTAPDSQTLTWQQLQAEAPTE